MKKILRSPLLPILLACTAALAGFFLRRIQLQTELLPGGFLAEGSFLHIILLCLSCVCIVSFPLLLLPLEKKEDWRQIFPPKPLSHTLLIVAAAVLLVGNVILLLQGSSAAIISKAPAMAALLDRLDAPLGLLAAFCMILFSAFCLQDKKPSPLCYMAVSLYLAVRLISQFQVWNTDPFIHDYCYQLLAAICCMLAAFHLAGFSFGKGKRRMTLFWSLCAVVFCGFTIADLLHARDLSGLLITVALFLSMAVCSVRLLFGEDTQ